MSETKVEIVAVKEVSAEMRHPKSCMCEICQPGSGMVYSPEGSSGAEQRIAALEEQLQIRDAEIHLLKESRAAAVSQEQTSRVECNKLRAQLAEAQAACAEKDRALDVAASFKAFDSEAQDYYLFSNSPAYQEAKSSTCGQSLLAERDRLRKALEEISQLKEGTGPSARAWAIASEALKAKP